MFYLRVVFCGLAVACCAASQPSPELGPAGPVAVKVGQTVELRLGGTHLRSIQSAAMSDARGVTVTLAEPAKDDQLRVKLSAAADSAVGERQVRFVGPYGVTRALRLLVSGYDVRPLKGSDEAQDVQLPATVVGQVATAGEYQQFRFHGGKGELLIFDVSARRTGSPLEAVVTVQSDSARQLRTRVEQHGGDPLVLFTPPEDGTYLLRLRDLRFRGGADYGFRINAGHIPYLESVMPGSGKPGTVIKAKPIGYNLDGAESIAIDLSHTAPGRINVHAVAPLGVSNEIPFEVTDLPQFAEAEPNDSPDEANSVQLPVEVSGSAGRSADEDFFRFRIPYRQPVSLEVLAARFGSPMVPLVRLRDAKGNVIEANDGTPDTDGRIIRELDAGDYLASVRDLAYSGGPGHWYRLKIEPARSLQPDFSVRFQPDGPRVHRGGSVAVWFDVRRTNGLRGDITLVPQSLPAGVNVSPLTLPENGSGWLTVSATTDAPLGTAPLRIAAQASGGMATVSHEPQADAYLTVLEPAPFTLQTTANLTPQQMEEANGRLASLAAKLAAPTDSRLEASQAQWEKRVPKQPVWQPLEAASVSSAKGAKMLRLSDSSILVAGNIADQDEYTVVVRTDLKGITAVRLEAINDERLPGSGPGTAPTGNFVLSQFNATVSKDGETSQPVALLRATADFAQDNFPAAAAIDGKAGTGWAIDPQEGRRHSAIFRTASPIGSGPGTTLTFVLSHRSAFARHNLGRFRISVTTLEPSLLNEFSDVPPGVLAAVAVPREQRSVRQRGDIAAYYHTIDPELAAVRNEVAALRAFVGPQSELQRLQTALAGSTPQLEADQKRWEQSVVRGDGWTVLQPTSLTSDGGSALSRDADGSVFAQGGSGSEEVYHVTAPAPLKSVTAVRLEALPDPRLPGGGPGRGDDGSFSLTGIEITRSGGTVVGGDVHITGARATAEQKDTPISSLIGKGKTHQWSTGAGGGLPIDATFRFDPPTADGPVTLTIALHQPAKQSLGRFRLWVTANANPDAAGRVPDPVVAIVNTPDAARSPGQRKQVSDYFRTIAPSLAAVRDRMGELRGRVMAVPPQARRNQPAGIPVLANRAAGFKGNLTVTLEGYAPGNPKMIARQIKVTPLVLNGDAVYGVLSVQPEPGAELATRMVVLKAEAKMGDDVVTQYSPAFPLTIQN